MNLLDRLREHLRHVERGDAISARPTVGIDLPAAREYFLRAQEQRERDTESDWPAEAASWDRTQRDHFLWELETELRAGPCANGDVTVLQEHIRHAIDLLFDLPVSGLSLARTRELRQIARGASAAASGPGETIDVARYALELRLVRLQIQRTSVSAIGQVLLRLPEADSIQWVLLVETLQSIGNSDFHRMPMAAIVYMSEHPEQSFYPVPDYDDDGEVVLVGDDWPSTASAMERLSSFGVVSRWVSPDGPEWGYTVRPAFRPMLAEIASQKHTPFSVLAETLIAEERAALLPPIAAERGDFTDSATLALERHSRMVAHELQNSILPVQHALQKLGDILTQSAPDDGWKVYQQRISRNVDRVLRFATQMAETSTLAVKPVESFDPALAIRDALAEINGGLASRVQFAPTSDGLLVRGHRHRFVMVMVNLLRNAVQSVPDRDVGVRIELGAVDAKKVRVAVHDDGPGVAEPYRDAIFQQNFTLRLDGRGQGLSLVKDVVEGEMGGTVRYESSDLGGACFTLLLPDHSRRSP